MPAKNVITEYNPLDVTLVVNNKLIDNYADGSMITVSETNDHVTPVTNNQGDGIVAISNKRLGQMTVNLLISSEANADFTDYSNNRTMFSAYVTFKGDKRGGQRCYISKIPDINYDATVPTQAWVIHLLDFSAQNTNR